jgi:ubiquinone biosynthesis protein
MTREFLELCGAQAIPNAGPLEAEISNLIEDYAYLSLHEFNMGEFFTQITRLLRIYHLHLPRYYVWLLRVISLVENMTRQLVPDFNLAEYSRPYVQRLLVKSLNPKEQVRKLRYTAEDFLQLLKDLPYESRNILRQLSKGQLKVEVEPVGLETVRLTFNHIFNRVVVAIIVAAMVVGSSIIMHSGTPPLMSGIPIIGLTGFILAALLGIWVTISVLRNGIS